MQRRAIHVLIRESVERAFGAYRVNEEKGELEVLKREEPLLGLGGVPVKPLQCKTGGVHVELPTNDAHLHADFQTLVDRLAPLDAAIKPSQRDWLPPEKKGERVRPMDAKDPYAEIDYIAKQALLGMNAEREPYRFYAVYRPNHPRGPRLEVHAVRLSIVPRRKDAERLFRRSAHEPRSEEEVRALNEDARHLLARGKRVLDPALVAIVTHHPREHTLNVRLTHFLAEDAVPIVFHPDAFHLRND